MLLFIVYRVPFEGVKVAQCRMKHTNQSVVVDRVLYYADSDRCYLLRILEKGQRASSGFCWGPIAITVGLLGLSPTSLSCVSAISSSLNVSSVDSDDLPSCDLLVFSIIEHKFDVSSGIDSENPLLEGSNGFSHAGE